VADPRLETDRVPLTDEEIRAATIGELQPLSGPIALAEYDPEWLRLFEREAARIMTALGEGALQIEHVGSTSVPGLAAKPIIDIILVVADSANEQEYVPPLEAAGYVLRIREPDWFEHRVFKGPDTNINMHVFSRGCDEIQRMLAFRDWLRRNDADRGLLRAQQARARAAGMEVRSELRRCQDGRRGGDRRAGARRRRVLASPGRTALVARLAREPVHCAARRVRDVQLIASVALAEEGQVLPVP
jgi:GrpB-like predicted nucleotidyltransferase (UPF0157 family)